MCHQLELHACVHHVANRPHPMHTHAHPYTHVIQYCQVFSVCRCVWPTATSLSTQQYTPTWGRVLFPWQPASVVVTYTIHTHVLDTVVTCEVCLLDTIHLYIVKHLKLIISSCGATTAEICVSSHIRVWVDNRF